MFEGKPFFFSKEGEKKKQIGKKKTEGEKRKFSPGDVEFFFFEKEKIRTKKKRKKHFFSIRFDQQSNNFGSKPINSIFFLLFSF